MESLLFVLLFSGFWQKMEALYSSETLSSICQSTTRCRNTKDHSIIHQLIPWKWRCSIFETLVLRQKTTVWIISLMPWRWREQLPAKRSYLPMYQTTTRCHNPEDHNMKLLPYRWRQQRPAKHWYYLLDYTEWYTRRPQYESLPLTLKLNVTRSSETSANVTRLQAVTSQHSDRHEILKSHEYLQNIQLFLNLKFRLMEAFHYPVTVHFMIDIAVFSVGFALSSGPHTLFWPCFYLQVRFMLFVGFVTWSTQALTLYLACWMRVSNMTRSIVVVVMVAFCEGRTVTKTLL
jgi:hypothetical protein